MKETFILGSGRSLLDLTAEEVRYVNSADMTISFNKYLVYYEKVGIVPRVHLQFDAADPPSFYVLLKTIEKVLHHTELDHVFLGYKPELAAIARKYIGRKRCFCISDNVECWNVADFTTQTWARSLHERMFHFRGALTSVINFAHVIRPGNLIKLIGVDMDTHEYFFQEEFDQDVNFHDWTYEPMKRSGAHSNILTSEAFGGTSQEVCMEWVREKVRGTGGDLVTASASSYYAKKKILEFRPLIEKGTQSTEEVKLTATPKRLDPKRGFVPVESRNWSNTDHPVLLLRRKWARARLQRYLNAIAGVSAGTRSNG